MKNLSRFLLWASRKFLFLKPKVIAAILFLFSALPVQSGSPRVVINEIAWMGTESSYSNEWIELYNNTDLSTSLDGWSLKASNGTPEINLSGVIPSYGFYLLERTDDSAVPNITADQIYTGSLNNKEEYLKLFDGQNNLIDEIDCNQGWFSGDNSTKQTMERKNPQLSGNDSENWQISQNPGGTPKAKNSSGLAETGSPPTEDEKVKEKLEPVSYPSGIIFSEILPSPEGLDAENEWVEISNQNNFEIDLSDWKISDTVGSTKTYIFPKETKIEAGCFLVLWRTETEITLNNSGDGLNLIRPDNKVADSVFYEKAPRGKSYSRVDSNWVWNNSLTPGNINVISPVENLGQKKESKKEISEKPKIESVETDVLQKTKRGLAAAAEQTPKEKLNFSNVSLIALSFAILSGITVLFLKTKLKDRHFDNSISNPNNS